MGASTVATVPLRFYIDTDSDTTPGAGAGTKDRYRIHITEETVR